MKYAASRSLQTAESPSCQNDLGCGTKVDYSFERHYAVFASQFSFTKLQQGGQKIRKTSNRNLFLWNPVVRLLFPFLYSANEFEIRLHCFSHYLDDFVRNGGGEKQCLSINISSTGQLLLDIRDFGKETCVQ